VRVGGDAVEAFGWEIAEFGDEGAGFVEELFGAIAFHPMLDELEVSGVGDGVEDGHLMGAP